VNAFLVELKNQPGALAQVTEAIAQKGIDIVSFSGATSGSSGTVALITNDESATRRVLADGGFTVREIELVTAALAQRPGTLAAAARRLADAGVNIEAALATGMSDRGVHVAFATDDPARARQALGDQVLAGSAA
jgi:hypothetical protein